MWNADAELFNEDHRVFCGSMCDVFERRNDLDAIRKDLWPLIYDTRRLSWQLLTKRIGDARDMLPDDWGDGYQNVWLGTSVENSSVLHRVDELRKIPAAVRFLSIEPLLGSMPDLDLAGIHWVIVGGESGANHRVMCDPWVREIYEACQRQKVRYFFKQISGPRSGMPSPLDEPAFRTREFP